MGVFNSTMASMSFVSESAHDGALADAAALTLVDYTGQGRVFNVSVYSNQFLQDIGLGINTEGAGEVEADFDDSSQQQSGGYYQISADYGVITLGIEFVSSCVVKLYNRSGVAAIVSGMSMYGTLSHETDRFVIPPGDEIPHRPYVEDTDVMCIMIQSDTGGLGSRLIRPSSQKVDFKQGKILDHEFNTNLNGPVRSWIQSNFTGSMKTVLNGELITIDVVNGVIQVVPKFIRAIDFWDRFTEAEQEDLHDSNHKKAKNFMCRFKMKKHINLAEAKMITAVRNLESGKFIAPGRADEILG